ncbi:hypothetical protein IFM89_030769 [Coptis chinensis]|uniref:Uncharacterized protein n=1 Tax=Coptis chinensis TaxID=261450 RepID=A0A835M2H2_9MAGN|nr:hypothetical protein IFM89_030769 [Coptis chinensis]
MVGGFRSEFSSTNGGAKFQFLPKSYFVQSPKLYRFHIVNNSESTQDLKDSLKSTQIYLSNSLFGGVLKGNPFKDLDEQLILSCCPRLLLQGSTAGVEVSKRLYGWQQAPAPKMCNIYVVYDRTKGTKMKEEEQNLSKNFLTVVMDNASEFLVDGSGCFMSQSVPGNRILHVERKKPLSHNGLPLHKTNEGLIGWRMIENITRWEKKWGRQHYFWVWENQIKRAPFREQGKEVRMQREEEVRSEIGCVKERARGASGRL